MKQIYSNFISGLSSSDRQGIRGSYFIGDGVDIHSAPGYIQPGVVAETITKSDDGPQIIKSSIDDILVDSLNQKVYLHDGTDLYQMTSIDNETFNANFDGASHYYKTITSALGQIGHARLALYPIGATTKLFYAHDISTTKGEVGMFDLSTTFDDNFMSDIPAGKAELAYARHPMLEWNSFLWIGNGRHLAKFNGQTGADGTLDAEAFALPIGWEITSLFPTQNYIGICAWKKGTAGIFSLNRVYFWDGISTAYSYFIPIEDNFIQQAVNTNGIIYFVGTGRDQQANLYQLTEAGSVKIMPLKHIIDGTEIKFEGIFPGAMAISEHGLLIGGADGRAVIFSYGRKDIKDPLAFSIPHVISSSASTAVSVIRPINRTKFFFSWGTASVFYLSKITLANTTKGTARWKGLYTDMEQKVRINYVKFYFKPLVSGDVITPTLDIDYGTSIPLSDPGKNTTISYALDGAIASKKFYAKYDCHSFRPCLSWTAGGTAFSKVVVDYKFISDN